MLRLLPRTTACFLVLFAAAVLLLLPISGSPAQADVPTTPVADLVEEWAVGNGLLYWANNCFADEFNSLAVLKRKPSGGGPERTLESINDGNLCNTYQSMLSSDDGLYFFNRSLSRIERMPLGEPFTPQPVKTLGSGQLPIGLRGFVEAAGLLYWLSDSNTILRTRTDGSGPIETVATTNSLPTDLMLVGATVYWSDSAAIWSISVGCDTLPCTSTQSQFSNLGATGARPYGLLFQALGGVQGNYRIYWVERTGSAANFEYQIRYRACNRLVVCFVLPPQGQLPPPPPSFYSGTPNWQIGNLGLANDNLYWTEADQSTPSNNNGDVKRKAFNATTPGADTIATGQGNLDARIFVDATALFFARRGVGILSLPLNASAIVRDFSAEGLEVTQAIQNLANSAPLVAKKTTFVRAYARQLSGPNTPNVQARLVGLKNNLPLPGSPLQPLNGVRALISGADFNRARLNDGWLFQLPPGWTEAGAISLRLEVDPRQNHSDPNRDNNQISQTVSFQDVPPTCVWTVPVRTHTPLPSINDPNFWAMIDHFKRRWPSPDVWIFRDTNPVEELEICTYYGIPYPCYGPYELEDGWGLGGMPDRDKVIVSLWIRAQLSFNPDACDDIGAPVHFMGLVHPTANNGGAAGYASTISKQSWVQLPDHTPSPLPASWDAMREGSVMAQELAHNYGRRHVDCNNPEDIDTNYPYPPCQIAPVGPTSYYGFDVTTLQPIRPDQTADFMSYSRRSWVSDYTWRALLSAIKNNAAASTHDASLAAPGDSVFVAGLVDAENHRGEISTVLVLPTGSLPPATRQALRLQSPGLSHSDSQAANYSLRLLGQGGAVLVDRALALSLLDDHGREGAAALFSDLFPQPTAPVAEIQLLADGAVVDSLKPGTSTPTLSVQQPVGGALLDNLLTVQWTASDPDPDDRLLFSVQYSHDSGASWHTLALNVPSTASPTMILSFDELGSLHGSGPNGALVRVLASDGYNTAIATSQPFTLQNRRPEPAISSPGTNQTFAAGQAVPLRGSALDGEDGGLPPASLSWQIDGLSQGNGADLSVNGLAPGAHVAALNAIDSLGQTASTTVSFKIASLSLPLADAPALDGRCEDASYASASSLPLKPYPDGNQATLRLLRSADYLWACFVGLQKGAPGTAAFVGLRTDIDHSRDALAQPSDAGFFVGENGDVFTRAGDGAGGFGSSGPAGLQAQVAAGVETWSAELRVEAATLGGWEHLLGLSAGHYALAAPADAYPWPFSAESNRPNTWATTALGDQPQISLIEPFTSTLGSPSFTLIITGSGFVSGTVALWNETELPTSVVDGQQLLAQVDASLLSSAGLVPVTTRSPGAAGFRSNAAAFLVEAPAPAISGLSPGNIRAGSFAFTLRVAGSNFSPGAQVLWNGQPLPTQFVSASELSARVDAALLVNGQTIGVAVRTQSPSEQISAVAPFTVLAQAERGYRLPVILR
jgi:hypothetical protein